MRKRFLLSIALISIIVGSLYAINNHHTDTVANKSEILFIEQDWAKTQQLAKDNHKLIFVDLYATWCGPCKMLKRNTFTNKEVADFFNANFINASIDVEKGVGLTLAEQYNVSMLPTLIITREDGKPVLFTTGYLDAKELMKFAKAAIDKSKK